MNVVIRFHCVSATYEFSYHSSLLLSLYSWILEISSYSFAWLTQHARQSYNRFGSHVKYLHLFVYSLHLIIVMCATLKSDKWNKWHLFPADAYSNQWISLTLTTSTTTMTVIDYSHLLVCLSMYLPFYNCLVFLGYCC